MLGAVLMKRDKDGKERLVNKDDVKSAQGYSRFIAGEPPTDTVDREGYYSALGHLGFALLNGALFRPKTYERLIHDLYVAGWTIEEVKTLLNGGKIDEDRAKN